MKLAYCTVKMFALIFFLFLSFNGAMNRIDAPASNKIVRPIDAMVESWGEPVHVYPSESLDFTRHVANAQVWIYRHPDRFVIVQAGKIVMIRSCSDTELVPSALAVQEPEVPVIPQATIDE